MFSINATILEFCCVFCEVVLPLLFEVLNMSKVLVSPSQGLRRWHSLKTDDEGETLQELQPMRATLGFAELGVPQ